MHATLEQLLAVRDGEAAPGTSAHVAACTDCAGEVERLRRTAAALRALPELRPTADRWSAVRAAFEARQRRKRIEWMGGAVLALAASLALVVVAPRALRTMLAGRSVAVAPVASRAGAAETQQLEALVRRSQRLEAELRGGDPQGRVIDAGTASTVADLEDSIALIDARLASAPARRASSSDVIGLWRERVRLMNALVDTHDARPVYAGL
ncbi:MAG TPA: hypothetical protein VE404_01625 [Verrucomicrobiae bacterium]|nr:hypothetical protein [Verrucomicrobiae bacterium]